MVAGQRERGAGDAQRQGDREQPAPEHPMPLRLLQHAGTVQRGAEQQAAGYEEGQAPAGHAPVHVVFEIGAGQRVQVVAGKLASAAALA